MDDQNTQQQVPEQAPTRKSFPVEKKLDLSYLGSDWQGAFVSFSALSFAETRQFAKSGLDADNPDNSKNLDIVAELLEGHFLAGKAWDGQSLVDITASQVVDLPTEVITKAVQTLAGSTDPNS